MLAGIDLSRRMSKEDFKAQKSELELEWGGIQRKLRELDIPVVVVFEGWDAAGKGTLINDFIMPLDPRGFSLYSGQAPNEEEKLRPFLWRFWLRVPAAGRMTIFDRSWYRRLLNDRVDRVVDKRLGRQDIEDIVAFERTLADNGTAIVKFFLHISKKEQARRLDRLRRNKTTAWRVTAGDVKRHRQYGRYLKAAEAMLTGTDSDFAPWTVIEAEQQRFATVKMLRTAIAVLTRRMGEAKKRSGPRARRAPKPSAAVDGVSYLDRVDLSASLDRETYDRRLVRNQKKLRELEHVMHLRRLPVVILYEGWDAAGKGGNLKRLTRRLDPRGYEVVPVAAPNDIERAHPWLWRFWKAVPKAGHMTIMDRSWYGRVMVERVEGFCSEAEWRRAYREINEMERHWVHFGIVLVKFWLQIDSDEQLRRFKAREKTKHKRWKITDEDWRNREKWDAYEEAVNEMLFRTHTPEAPWTIVESNCKRYARIKAQDTVIQAIESRL